VHTDRPYQSDAISANLAEYDKGIHRMMNVMATGTGKTHVIGRMYEALKSRLPGQMMVIAHTEELVKQNAKGLQELNPTLKVGIEMAGEYADFESTDIASVSVASLGRSGTKRVERINWNRLDKFVIDEAHHSVTDAYGRILELGGVMRPDSNKFLLGVTATCQRPDGRALSDIYDRVSYMYSMRQAIKDKWLVPVRGFRVTTDTNLSEVEVSSGGDFVVSQLSSRVDTPERNRQVVTHWKKLAGDRKTVVFAASVDHAKHLAERFRESDITCEAIWGDDPDRAEKLRSHREGKFQVLVNCNVLVEGYDDPSIACVLLARPTKSPVLFAQMVGRGTRLFDGKADLIVIDVVDSTVGASLMTLPTLMGLSNQIDLQGRDMLEVVEEIEALQLDHPSIDLTRLKTVDELLTVVKSVDLFEVRFPAEVEANSDLIWYRAIDGGYKINIPKDGMSKAGFMHIRENQLGQWEIAGQIKETDLAAIRPSLEEAFKASDEQIRKRIDKVRLQYILREATWHNKPVSIGQRKMLERLFPYRQFPWDTLTSGAASKLIAERLNKK